MPVDALPVDTGSQVELIHGNRQFLKNIIFQIRIKLNVYASICDEGASSYRCEIKTITEEFCYL